MEPIFTIDNGEKKAYLIASDGTFGLYEVGIQGGGVTPIELRGKYSKAVDAKRVVEAYIDAEEVREEIKKRRKAVKVGKEKWADRKAKEAAESQQAVQEAEANGEG